jgi:membrane-associated phospholipid phosphatase
LTAICDRYAVVVHPAFVPRDALNRHCLNLRWLIGALLLAPLMLLCIRYLDIPVALFVKSHLYKNSHWSRLTTNLPDLLLVLVLVITLSALSLYLVRSRKGIYDRLTCFAKEVAWTAPLSYLAKSSLKFVFGRVNTRCWLKEPGLYGFHWFQRRVGCEGFPSGHMIVVVALLAAGWRCYPKSRPVCLTVAVLLGVALVATNYHFVSDVIAGAYVGALVEAVVFALLAPAPPRLPEPSAR